jgi:hypothetical protein
VTVVDVLAYAEVHRLTEDAALCSDMTWYSAQRIDVRDGGIVHFSVAGDPRPRLPGKRSAAVVPLTSLTLAAFRESTRRAPLDAELFLVDPGLSVHPVIDLSHGDGYLLLQRKRTAQAPRRSGPVRRHAQGLDLA